MTVRFDPWSRGGLIFIMMLAIFVIVQFAHFIGESSTSNPEYLSSLQRKVAEQEQLIANLLDPIDAQTADRLQPRSRAGTDDTSTSTSLASSSNCTDELETFRNILLNPNEALCRNVQIESNGADVNEPDTHICLDSIREPCTVLSFGIAYDFSFDRMMLDKGCRVWSFDPSMRPGNYTNHTNHQFYRIGIGNVDGAHQGKSTLWSEDDHYEVATLSTLMQQFDISYIDLVRMDIESAEWEVLQDWLDKDLFQYIGQLLLEIHIYVKQKDCMDVQPFARIVNRIPLKAFWAQRNRWNGQKVHREITQVYELDLINVT